MPNKTVNFIGTPINAATIADFYNRLNALRALNGGTTTVSFSAPPVGTQTLGSVIANVETEILATKSALAFLANVNISTHTPATVATGDLIEAQTTVHPEEWQIGQLEMACFTNFTTNRVTNNETNFASNAKNSCGTHLAAQNTTNKTSHNTSDGTTGSNCSGHWGSVRNTVHSPQNAPNHSAHSTFRSGYFSTYRQYVNTRFHGGHGCSTWGSNYSPKQKTFHKTFFGTQRASDGATFSADNGSHYAGDNNSVKTSVNSSKYNTQSNCGTVFSAHDTTFKSANRTSYNATNCPTNAESYLANWGTYVVGNPALT